MIVIAGLLLGAALFGGLLWRIAPNQSLLDVSREDIHFPTVSGFNLNRQEFTFQNTELILEVAAKIIRARPDEWMMFHPVWPHLLES